MLFFCPSPLSEKRRIKSAKPQEKRQEDPGVPFMKTGGMPERVSSYGGEAILRGETEERSCSEESLKDKPREESRTSRRLKLKKTVAAAQ